MRTQLYTQKFMYLVLALIIFGLSACHTSTQFSSLRPSDIVLPNHIKTIVLIDRSQPSKGFNNVLEGILTGEGIGQDYIGRKEVINGLFHTLATSPKYDIVPTGIELEGSKAGNRMAMPLSWSQLQEIADQYDADAVLAIESYDSDQFTTFDTRTSSSKDSDGNVRKSTMYYADRSVDISLGYRLYDVKKQRIVDEHIARVGYDDQSKGDSRLEAQLRLKNKRNLLRAVSADMGHEYSKRIAPVYVTENRRYFQSAAQAHNEMNTAHRAMLGGDFEYAMSIWSEVAQTAKKNRTRAKAKYNLAVANEIIGDLDSAIEWAGTSYVEHRFNRAGDYLEILNYKQHQSNRLKNQMSDVSQTDRPE